MLMKLSSIFSHTMFNSSNLFPFFSILSKLFNSLPKDFVRTYIIANSPNKSDLIELSFNKSFSISKKLKINTPQI